MLKLFFPPFVIGTGAVGLLVFRVVIGSGFLLHSLAKLKDPTRWMQTEGVPPSPPAIQVLSACMECAAGSGFILGFLSPLAALAMIATMIGAMMKVHIPGRHPFVAPPSKDSSESCLIYFGAGVLMLLIGPGAYSLDAVWLPMMR